MAVGQQDHHELIWFWANNLVVKSNQPWGHLLKANILNWAQCGFAFQTDRNQSYFQATQIQFIA